MKGKTYLSLEAAPHPYGKENDSNTSVLTRREKEVLELIADGMTNNEIAQNFLSV